MRAPLPLPQADELGDLIPALPQRAGTRLGHEPDQVSATAGFAGTGGGRELITKPIRKRGPEPNWRHDDFEECCGVQRAKRKHGDLQGLMARGGGRTADTTIFSQDSGGGDLALVAGTFVIGPTAGLPLVSRGFRVGLGHQTAFVTKSAHMYAEDADQRSPYTRTRPVLTVRRVGYRFAADAT
jgi:hypothetical protein